MNYESIIRSGELQPFSVQETLCRNVVVLHIFPSIPIESASFIIKRLINNFIQIELKNSHFTNIIFMSMSPFSKSAKVWPNFLEAIF